jgi:tetratricopeptide (TPR) repeat protein
MSKGDYQAAIAELRLAVLHNPTGAAEHRVLGQALLLTHDDPGAVRELQIAVSLNPDSATAHHYLAIAWGNVNKYEQALKEHREALRLDASADNHYYVAICLIRMGRNDEALAELETAARIDPKQSLYRARMDELQKVMQAESR